jgi:hypothetical protein
VVTIYNLLRCNLALRETIKKWAQATRYASFGRATGSVTFCGFSYDEKMCCLVHKKIVEKHVYYGSSVSHKLCLGAGIHYKV